MLKTSWRTFRSQHCLMSLLSRAEKYGSAVGNGIAEGVTPEARSTSELCVRKEPLDTKSYS